MIDRYNLDDDFICKDVFPYIYINSFDHYNIKDFPDVNYFNTDKTTYEKYRKFYYTHFMNLGQYSDYYLQKDVLLLSDTMDTYRSMFTENYQNELFSHYTINSLTWESFNKYNHQINIKLLSNYSIYSAFEKNEERRVMRRGINEIRCI